MHTSLRVSPLELSGISRLACLGYHCMNARCEKGIPTSNLTSRLDSLGVTGKTPNCLCPIFSIW